MSSPELSASISSTLSENVVCCWPPASRENTNVSDVKHAPLHRSIAPPRRRVCWYLLNALLTRYYLTCQAKCHRLSRDTLGQTAFVKHGKHSTLSYRTLGTNKLNTGAQFTLQRETYRILKYVKRSFVCVSVCLFVCLFIYLTNCSTHFDYRLFQRLK